MFSKNKNSKVFGPLVTRAEMSSIYNKRSSDKIFQTLRSKSNKTLLKKVEAEEEDGWKRFKKLKGAYKLSMYKPSDEQLEDRVWSMVSKMGYKELSENRQFKIEIPKDPTPRQIDVFAKDDEVALVIECTQSEKPVKSSKKDITEKINNITAFKGQIENAISSHYGRETKIKPRFIIATENVEWGAADLEKCRLQNIIVLTEKDIEYYEGLTKYLKNAARFQFHAHLFEGIGIPGLSMDVPSTKGVMGGTTFYSFLVKPNELLKIAYVGHKSTRSLENLQTYQRMLKPNRLNSIVKYLNDGGKFPTNIVVNFKTKKGKALRFDKRSKTGEMDFGQLTLPNQFASAWIIDGQHRLYGYAFRELKVGGPVDDNSVLSVLAFENLPAEQEMNMFIDINSKQVKVQKNLLGELYADLHWDSPEVSERFLALLFKVVGKLNTRKTSSIFDRVITTLNSKKTGNRCLTQTSLSDGFKVAGLIGSVKKEFFVPGPLSHHDPLKFDLSLEKAANVIENILAMFKASAPNNWELGDRAGGYLCTNIGIRAIFIVVKDICDQIKESTDLTYLNAEELTIEIEKYLKPLLIYFAEATPQGFQDFRNTGSSLAAVDRQSKEMNFIIKNSIPYYKPTGMENYISMRNQEGKGKAREQIEEIETIMKKYTITRLKEKYGPKEENWWFEGIPDTIKEKCAIAWTRNKEQGEKSDELYFIDYRDIAHKNWEEFKDVFSLGDKNSRAKNDMTKWMVKINDIRSKVVHASKGGFSTNDGDYLNEKHSKVLECFTHF